MPLSLSRCLFVTILSLCAAVVAAVHPQSEVKPLVVGVFVQPPFVLKDAGGTYSGFAIGIWEKIATEQKIRFDYKEFDTIPALLSAASLGQVDLAVSDLTVTHERLQRMDFCHPFYDAGFRIHDQLATNDILRPIDTKDERQRTP